MTLIDNVISQVPFVDYIIYSNGSCVFDRNVKKIIHADLIEDKLAREIVEYFLTQNVFFEIYINGKSNSEQRSCFKIWACRKNFLTRWLKLWTATTRLLIL